MIRWTVILGSSITTGHGAAVMASLASAPQWVELAAFVAMLVASAVMLATCVEIREKGARK